MSSRSSPPGPPTGPRVLGNRYELIEKLAEGGNALVYRAWDRDDSRWLAVKMLMPEFAKRSTLVQRFEREGDTMKHLLDHPNICRVYDMGTEHDGLWIAMEYAEAGSVINWVERWGPMPPHMATRVAIELCKGIAYAHSEGVVHRDVKPQNLLLYRDGRCKVTDFGIAQIEARTRVTMTGTVMGTIGYIAPEQHESAKHADQRADVYSIAATVYTLVHGEAATHLFMAEDRDFDGIPEPLAVVIRKGAQYRREARYQTVDEMQRAFEAILVELPPDPPSTPPLVPPESEQLPAPSRGAVSPPPIEEHSLEPLRDLRPQPYDRTPSSIIPRNSLTGSSKIRRTQVRNRADIDRQRRIRVVAVAVGMVTMFAFFAVLVVAGYGTMQIDRYEGLADAGLNSLYEQLHLEAALTELPNLADKEGLEKLFVEAEEGWHDKSPDERIGDVQRILDNIHTRVIEIENHGRTDAISRTYFELSQAHKRLSEDVAIYRSRTDDLEEYRSGLLGQLGSALQLSR